MAFLSNHIEAPLFMAKAKSNSRAARTIARTKPTIDVASQLLPAGGEVITDSKKSQEPEPRQIGNFDDLVKLATEPKKLRFDLRGQPVEMQVRPLTGDEQVNADKITAIIPPRKPVVDGKEAEFDFENPSYVEKMKEADLRKRAFIIDCAVIGLKIPGDTLEDKTKKLYSMLQTGVIDTLVSAVLQLTQNPVEHAVFI